MIKIFAITFFGLMGIIPFHSMTITGADNSMLNLDSLGNKKVLIINTASNSPDSAQFASLEELYQQYHEQLQIIIVPSNDYGNEPLSNSEMIDSLHARYHIHYFVAQQQGVKDSSTTSVLYQWLTQKAKNGMTDSHVQNDFYKYLINASGQLVGIYSNMVQPTDAAIVDAIQK